MSTSQQPPSTRSLVEEPGEYVEFFISGTYVKGVFQCVSCGRSVAVSDRLTRCRGCGDELWERGEWSPFHAAERLH